MSFSHEISAACNVLCEKGTSFLRMDSGSSIVDNRLAPALQWMPNLLCDRRLGRHHQHAPLQLLTQPRVQAEVRLLDCLKVRGQERQRCSIDADEVGANHSVKIELDWAVPKPRDVLLGVDGDLLEDFNVCQRPAVILLENNTVNRQSTIDNRQSHPVHVCQSTIAFRSRFFLLQS